MKAKVAVLITAFGAVACALWLSFSARQLPRIKLSDGSDFRVVRIRYGTADDHYFLRAPKAFFWMWNHLPTPLQSVVPSPNEGVGGEFPPPNHTALSIWWAWFDPVTRKPLLGPSGDVIMTLDSGEQKNLGWPNPVDDYRQIFIMDPPTDSKRLRFSVPVNWLEKPAVFEIENPAYGKSR
jgi:hypothetical protein